MRQRVNLNYINIEVKILVLLTSGERELTVEFSGKN